MENPSFYLTVFINGGAILVLEILGTRILAPFYGSTIYVWSSLITTTMASLALGYFLGGKLDDKKTKLRPSLSFDSCKRGSYSSYSSF